MRYLKKELLLIIMVLSVTIAVRFFLYRPAGEKIEILGTESVILKREINALQAVAREAPSLEKEVIALSHRLERLKVREHLQRRCPLYIMGVLSKLAEEAGVEISPPRIIEAHPNWSGLEMTIGARSFSSFGNYLARLLNSHLLFKVRNATIKPAPEGRGLTIELILDGWTGTNQESEARIQEPE